MYIYIYLIILSLIMVEVTETSPIFVQNKLYQKMHHQSKFKAL